MRSADRYRRWLNKAAGSRLARSWLGPQVITRLDRRLFRFLHGSIVSLGTRAFPTLLLTTTGRRTGRRHIVPLFYLPQDGSFLVVASNYGRRPHPAWSYNLLAGGPTLVEIEGESMKVTARLLPEDEKVRVWPDLLGLFETWQRYEAETERSIRVFELTPLTRS